MKKDSALGRMTILFALFFLMSCAHVQASEEEKMLTLGASLRNLCIAMEDIVKYEILPEGLSDTELLKRATMHDPGLLDPFNDYLVKPLIQDNSAILLVCSKDGKVGLLEDACCSYQMDKHLWKENQPMPCKITLDIRQACPPILRPQ